MDVDVYVYKSEIESFMQAFEVIAPRNGSYIVGNHPTNKKMLYIKLQECTHQEVFNLGCTYMMLVSEKQESKISSKKEKDKIIFVPWLKYYYLFIVVLILVITIFIFISYYSTLQDYHGLVDTNGILQDSTGNNLK